MIDVFSGTPGSGKSLHAVKYIREYLKHGDLVVSNSKIMIKERLKGSIIFLENKEVNPENLKLISDYYKSRINRKLKEDEILLVIDEAQISFNARDWRGEERLKWITFFSQHRKYFYHVILIVQYIDMIDKQIRALIEYDVRHRKVKNLGFMGKVIAILAGGDLFSCAWVYMGLNIKANSQWFIGKMDLYEMYNTFELYEKQK